MSGKLSSIFGFIKRRRVPVIILVLVGAAVGVTATLWGQRAEAGDYITSKIGRATVEVTVSATGTVQAVTTVQVGSQVSGTVAWLGADFNTKVRQGDVVAKLDPAVFQTQVQNQEASLLNANAAVQASNTDVTTQRANLQAAKANQEVSRVQRDDALALVKRYEELANVVSTRDIEAARAQANAAAARYEQATAQIAQAESAIELAKARLEQAKANVKQTQAQLAQTKVNLAHTIIASPIDGVVVSRNVDVGQTVAASLQAPVLFTIANDLTNMRVLASIDEADVGQLKPEMKANFTVDAHPGETFTGTISQIRLNAQTLQNVVTYTAVISVLNPDQKLLPGMTANITIPVARRENVLAIPNAALRFKPTLTEKQQQEMQQLIDARRQQRESERQQQAGQGEQGQGGAPAQTQQGDQQRGGQPSQTPGAANSQRRGEGGQPGREGAGSRPGGEQPQGAVQQGQQGDRQGGQPAASSPGQQAARQAGAPATGDGATRQGGDGQRRQFIQVWILTAEKKLEPRFIRTGITNGRVTEIISGDLNEGDVIITGVNEPGNSTAQQPATTPFGQRPGGGMGGGPPRR